MTDAAPRKGLAREMEGIDKGNPGDNGDVVARITFSQFSTRNPTEPEMARNGDKMQER